MRMNRDFTRREVLGMGLAGGGAALLGGRLVAAAEEAGKTDVWMIHGTDKAGLMKRALDVIDANGGFGEGVKKLTLKVNAAWWRTPEQGANTHPQLVDAFLKGVKGRGIKNVVLPENPVDAANNSFPQSGIEQVAKANGCPMVPMRGEALYTEVKLPKAKNLKAAAVGKHFLETDCLVNMPVAKHHGAAGLTIAMKNWLGAVSDRRFWHKNNLHQCIADFSTFIQPRWSIVDATRIMLDRGPKGPTKNMKTPDVVIVSRCQVAADLVAATLFTDRHRKQARYLDMARGMGLGPAGLDAINLRKIELA